MSQHGVGPHATVFVVVGLLGVFPVLISAQPAATPSATALPSTSPRVALPPQVVLSQFAAAWARVTAYTGTVTVFERKDTQVQNVVFEYTFRKPSSVTTHVDAGPNAGVTMVWDGGTTLVAHRGSGFAALFKKTLSLHDPK